MLLGLIGLSCMFSHGYFHARNIINGFSCQVHIFSSSAIFCGHVIFLYVTGLYFCIFSLFSEGVKCFE